MDKELAQKKREYDKKMDSLPLFSSQHGAISKLSESTGYSRLTVRRALAGGVNTEIAYKIRKDAYELYGFGFIL